jgi:hypothetical protein
MRNPFREYDHIWPMASKEKPESGELGPFDPGMCDHAHMRAAAEKSTITIFSQTDDDATSPAFQPKNQFYDMFLCASVLGGLAQEKDQR